ncbi:MAG: acyl-CoA dehydrogenase family protein [Planctomycetota bacterium]|nr:acyl-CoA dehydrogenase family protein [Planctomycetota bacterium]
MPSHTDTHPATNAVNLILKQAGKSDEEIAAFSSLDDADRSAENQFSGVAPTLESLFGSAKAVEFFAGTFNPSKAVAEVMSQCLSFLLERKTTGTLCDHHKMLFHDQTIQGLRTRGFFGLAIPQQYGGSGAQLGDLGPLLRALTFVHPDLAVMFEVHNFLGPVTPILDFGTEEQKSYYLPKMARGELIGSFALTEPGVGADPSKLSMTATLDGESYRLNGIKWPITNVVYGGLCVLVLKLQGQDLPPGRDSAMILLEIPKQDCEGFRMKRNDLVAFDFLWNARFRLTDFRVPVTTLLGPPGKGLAQAFSSLAKGRGGIGVNSTAKIFKLLAQIILDPSQPEKIDSTHTKYKPGGWTSFRSTFGKPIGEAPRIQTWIGRAVCHGIAGRVMGDLCFRLAANGVRDETQGMIAKVYATKALLQTAINVYQIQGGRSVHTDEKRALIENRGESAFQETMALIENHVGENMHEFTIATVYEGPNPVLADVGAPNAMTRSLRAQYLEPIGLAAAEGRFHPMAYLKFAGFMAKSMLGSLNPCPGSLAGVEPLFPEKKRYIRNSLRRNKKLGRKILWIIARYQKQFIDQPLLLGDEGGIFDQLCHSMASLVFALSLDQPGSEYVQIGQALDLEAKIRLQGKTVTPKLQQQWSKIGQSLMNPQSQLHQDLISDIEIHDIPLDPRFIDQFI